MTSELNQILWRLHEARKVAQPGTKHYLIQAARQVEAAIEYEIEAAARKIGETEKQ